MSKKNGVETGASFNAKVRMPCGFEYTDKADLDETPECQYDWDAQSCECQAFKDKMGGE